jgi:hypothetical protein
VGLFIGLAMSGYIRIKFGDGIGWDRYPKMPEAEFSVGHRVMRSIRYGNEVEVFYPIAKGT